MATDKETVFDEIRNDIDGKDVGTVAKALHAIVNEVENLHVIFTTKIAKPVNNETPIKAPKIDDSKKTVVKGAKAIPSPEAGTVPAVPVDSTKKEK